MTRSALSRVLAGLLAGALLAGPTISRADEPSQIRAEIGAGSATQALSLPAGRSAVIDLPVDARDVLVSNPAVATAILRTPRRIYVLGVRSGATDAVFFDAQGRRILALNIRVDQNVSALADTINRMIPGSQVKVEGLNDSIVLSGMVRNDADADKAVLLARAAATKPDSVVNMLSIAGKDEVMVKVRIVEMDRQIIKQLGFNWQAVINQAGSTQFSFANAASFAVNGTLLGGLTSALIRDTTQQPQVNVFDPATGQTVPVVCTTCPTATTQTTSGSQGLNKFAAAIQAFEQVGLVRTLAEPNLTAVSGESARFLVGGEFPVPNSESVTGQVSIVFQPYGVGLGFTPIVLSGGRISLKLSTEVSELSSQGSFNVSTGAGGPTLVVPALTVRRAETTVELPSGGAMMIAGLLQDTSQQDLAGIPGVMDTPVLGALFRSRDYQAGETELVVIVTPYIVKPTNPSDLQTPADGLQMATDINTVLLGRLNKTYRHSLQATSGKTYEGPYGYVVE